MQGDHFKPHDLEYESDSERDEKIDAAGPYHQRRAGLVLDVRDLRGEVCYGRGRGVDLVGRGLFFVVTSMAWCAHMCEVSVAKNPGDGQCSSKLCMRVEGYLFVLLLIMPVE